MDKKHPIRVMLVDDHAVVRSGLGAFMMAFDDLELVAEAGSGEEAVRLCAQVHPEPEPVPVGQFTRVFF